VAFDETEALRGVDLHLAAGEWLGLIGPNGAGKSTLLRAIAGLVAHEGTVALDCGRRPSGVDVALVPQIPILPEGMTVAEYALLGRSPHLGWLAVESRRDRRIVSEVLERLELRDFADRPVTHLSGGETQRVVLARALTQQAPILLLDEPTSARGAAGGTAGRGLPAARLSDAHATPLSVHPVDGEIGVLPAPRARKDHRPGQATKHPSPCDPTSGASCARPRRWCW